MAQRFFSRRYIGVGLLLVVAAVAIAAWAFRPPPLTAVSGMIGGSKDGLLKNPEVEAILRDRYKLRVESKTAGSGDIVKACNSPEDSDFFWPADQLAVEQCRAQPNARVVRTETIFNSPLVLYSWDQVTQVLVQNRYVQRAGNTSYFNDFGRFVEEMHAGKEWKSLGLDFFGKTSINTTDPCRSNSGNSFAGLLTNFKVGGVVDESNVGTALSTVNAYFDRLGYSEPSSAGLFRAFLTKGVGANPIIVNYESLLIEYYHDNPAHQELLRTRINTLYPKPTVWASHIFIATNQNGLLLLEALKDKRIQEIAWERHGFRTGLSGVENDPKVHEGLGFAPTIESVMPLPKASVMDQINSGLCGNSATR